MNNLDRDIAEVIGEISKVAVLINLEGKHHIFIRDYGHVKNIEIDFHQRGWKENEIPALNQEIKYGRSDKEALKQLKKVRDDLYKILKNGQVSMEERDYDVEEIRHYKFY